MEMSSLLAHHVSWPLNMKFSLPSFSQMKFPYIKMATLEEKVLRNQDP